MTSRCAASWSTPAISKPRSRPLTSRPSMLRRVPASCPSTTYRPPHGQGPVTPCSGPARRRSTPAPGFWTTTWRQIGSAGSARGTIGFTTGATSRRWTSSATTWRASLSTPRRVRRRRTSRTCSIGWKHRGAWSGSTRRLARRCTASRCSVPSEIDALRQIEDVVRLGRVRRIEGDRIVLAAGRDRHRPRRPARRLHGARPAATHQRPPSFSAAGSCSSRSGRTLRRSTRR